MAIDPFAPRPLWMTAMTIATKPATFHRYYVTHFGKRDGPFDSLEAAFSFMRSCGYVLSEDVIAAMLTREDEAPPTPTPNG